MKVILPIKSFAGFKVIAGLLFFIIALVSPLFAYVSIFMLVLGRAHSLGAWFSMWRAKKLTWVYLTSILIFTSLISWWGFTVASLPVLAFTAYGLFAIHFLFDEFDLQEQKKNISSFVSSVLPLVLTLLYLFDDYLHFSIHITTYLLIASVFLLLEFVYLREINWFVIQTKILTLFVLIAIYIKLGSANVLNLFLLHHYFFWFLYPVYKLHKYKKEERDSFIMMLLIIVVLSIFVYSSKVWGGVDNIDVSFRSFYIASLVHVILTAPFGYLFGLPRPQVYDIRSST